MLIELGTLTAVHTGISVIALLLGIVAVLALLGWPAPGPWTELFLATAVATTVTGFLFPFRGMTPAIATGIVSSLVLLLVLIARYACHLKGAWRWVYASGVVASLYFLVFVAIAQAFTKIPPLHALAPTLAEPPFAVAQLLTLVAFVLIGRTAVKSFSRNGPPV